MKKFYAAVFLFFGLFFNNFAIGQIIANDLTADCGFNGCFVVLHTNTDISLNGIPITSANQSLITISLISADNGMTLSGNGVTIAPGLPTGTYVLNYLVCETANPSNCDTAVLTINIICITPAPIINLQTNCFNPGAVILYNMPQGNWTLVINGEPPIQGVGSTYFVGILNPGPYNFVVTDDSQGCLPSSSFIFIDPPVQTFFILPQTCNMPAGTVMLENLPNQPWTLVYGNPSTTVTGSGTSYTISGLSPGNYNFTLVSGPCSYTVATTIGSLNGGISGVLSAAYVDYNNDGITNLGDTVSYTIAISNISECNMDTVNYNFGNAQTPSPGQTITNLGAGASTNVLLTYVLTQEDINNGSVNNWIALYGYGNGYTSYSKVFGPSVTLTIADGIKLNAFFDTNNDGFQNNGETNANLGNFTYQLNNNGIDHFLYSDNGTNIIYESNPTNTYDLSYNLYNVCTGQYNVSTFNYNDVTVPSGSGIILFNFPITQSPCQDVQIYLYSSSPARPGFNYINNVYFKNIGNQVMASGMITFTKDNVLTINSISEPSAVSNAGGFTYNFTNLLPGEGRSISVNMLVPTIPTVSLGQLVNNLATISIPINDVDPNNNSSALTQTIVGSYDPNDKTESHNGQIVHSTFTADDYLTYTIRFENTGTDSAVNIRVNDLLDTSLDGTSIKMLRSSHPYVLDRVENALSWRFNGIDLPPSVEGDETTGHGYIVFQVKPKTGFALGDIIPNTANIYFDFNPAIVTNTCTTEFVTFLGINVFDANTFEYYPNPTSDIITFAMKNNTSFDTIEVMDILGKTLISKKVHYNNAEIDLSSFEKGIYLAKVKANGQLKTVKIIKE